MSKDVLPIVIYPDARLTQVSAAVNAVTDEIRTKLDKMAKAMRAHEGIGLAGVQVGMMERLIVVDHDVIMSRTKNNTAPTLGKPLFMVNAQIIETSDEQSVLTERCLSLPTIEVGVMRPVKIKAKYLDYEGNEQTIETDDELLAKCIQHEIDHNNGKLILDYASSPLRKNMLIKKLIKYKKFHTDCECHDSKAF